MCEGIVAELVGIDLEDKRLNERSKLITEALAADPQARELRSSGIFQSSDAVRGLKETSACESRSRRQELPPMTLRPFRRALSSPPRLSTVCFHQIVGLPSLAEAWHRSRDSTRGRAVRLSGNRRARRKQEGPGIQVKNGPRLEWICNLRPAPSAHTRQ